MSHYLIQLPSDVPTLKLWVVDTMHCWRQKLQLLDYGPQEGYFYFEHKISLFLSNSYTKIYSLFLLHLKETAQLILDMK